MARRRYTEEQKAEALKLYETHGPTAVQAQLDIPKGTVSRWAQAAGVGTVRNHRMREAVAAASLDAKARRQRIVENQMAITERLQAQTLAPRWKTLVRGEGGAEHTETLDYVPGRDAKDMLSALNSSSTIIARLDEQVTEHDDAKSVLADLIGGLNADYERRNPQ